MLNRSGFSRTTSKATGFLDRQEGIGRMPIKVVKHGNSTTLGTLVFAVLLLTLLAGSTDALSETHALGVGNSAAEHQAEYLRALANLRGTPYSELQCSSYICAAKKHANCTAQQMWENCNGTMELQQEVTSFSSLDESQMRAGDVVAFGGVHVAVYVGNGHYMDATPERGVNEMTLPVNPSDPWYRGRVRILRWKY
jgi:cell wall-associated NlpC family hydrolase